MSDPPSRFLFVITGRDVEPFVPPLVASLAAQTRRDWRALFVDDASRDDTLGALRRALETHGVEARSHVIANEERLYKVRNVYRALQAPVAAGAEIVVLLDADDRLGDTRALELLDREYRRGFDVVWSNWRGSDGSPGKSDHLSPLLPPSRQPFVSQHLFSFRRRLFDAVGERDLQDDEGRWFRAGCDAAIAWPVLEQTPRWRFIDRPLCIYNRANPASHKPSGNKWEQVRTLAILQQRPRRRPRIRSADDLRFVARHAGDLLGAALMNARLLRRYVRHRRRLQAYRAGLRTIE